MFRFIRLAVIFGVVTMFCVGAVVLVRAIDCNSEGFDKCKIDGSSCNNLITACQSQINDSVGQQKTLSSTISYLNTRIRLAETQITQTQFDITNLEKQIVELKTRIGGLELSLQRLTEVLISRIQDSYIHKAKLHDPILLLFSANELTQFFTQFKYIQLSQEYTQNLIQQAETQKVTFNDQKILKEQKQAELDTLKKKLVSQKSSLQDQQAQKQSLLQVTQNNEKRYQTLLQQANDELQKFKSFADSQGGSSLLDNQTKCDGWGCYYNQRDSQWGNQRIGSSPYSMKDSGCLVTSMAMIASHYGKSLKPGDIAGLSSIFTSGGYLTQSDWTLNGVTMKRTRLGSSTSLIDNELNAGRPVIVGLYSNLSHFIVIRGKDDRGYIMSDPLMENGGNRPFTDKYNTSQIHAVDRVQVN